MNYILYSKEFNEMLENKTCNIELISLESSIEDRTILNCSKAEISFQEIHLGNVKIVVGNYTIKKQLCLNFKVKSPFIALHFNLGGATSIGLNYIDNIQIQYMQHNIFSFNQTNGFVKFEEGQSFKTIDVHLPLEYFKKYLGQNKLLDNFLSKISSQKYSILYDKCHPISTEMFDTINLIMKCKLKGFSRVVYLESKVQELFSLQLAVNDYPIDTYLGVKKKLSAKDIELISGVKTYIENYLTKPKSIKEHAMHCGINQQKLKYGFKKLYGITMFAHLKKCRMLKAMSLLLQGMSVNEVAYSVGYANHSSFIHTFKSYYGYLPSKV